MECAHVACGRLCASLLSAKTHKEFEPHGRPLLWHGRIQPVLHILSKWIETNHLSDFNLRQLNDISVVFHSIWENQILCSNLGRDDYIYQSHMAETDYIYNGQSAPLTPDRHRGAPISPIWGKGTQPANPEFPPISQNMQPGNYKNTPGKHIIYSQNHIWGIIRELLVVCAKLICINI